MKKAFIAFALLLSSCSHRDARKAVEVRSKVYSVKPSDCGLRLDIRAVNTIYLPPFAVPIGCEILMIGPGAHLTEVYMVPQAPRTELLLPGLWIGGNAVTVFVLNVDYVWVHADITGGIS